jgi:hypothetical protein
MSFLQKKSLHVPRTPLYLNHTQSENFTPRNLHLKKIQIQGHVDKLFIFANFSFKGAVISASRTNSKLNIIVVDLK